MNSLQKLILGTIISGAVASTPVLAQVPLDNDFVKQFPYFAQLDKGDLKPDMVEKIYHDLKDPNRFKSGWKQEVLDRIYAQLTSGPMPSGYFEETIITSSETNDGRTANGTIDVKLRTFDNGLDILEDIGLPIDKDQVRGLAELMSTGKYFDPAIKVVKNRVDCKNLPVAIKALNLFTGLVHCKSGGEGIHRNDLNFPAKLYCGQSLIDGRRESIIIDYNYGDDIGRSKDENVRSLWDSRIDALPTKAGLGIRDEIRMVKPGFYLGRVHIKQPLNAFILWFTLETRTPADESAEDACWIGYQRQRQRSEAVGPGGGFGYSAYMNKGLVK
jgi:hypothetical protein